MKIKIINIILFIVTTKIHCLSKMYTILFQLTTFLANLAKGNVSRRLSSVNFSYFNLLL
jgi:hypothetical protein